MHLPRETGDKGRAEGPARGPGDPPGPPESAALPRAVGRAAAGGLLRVHRVLGAQRSVADRHLGFGRIVASEIEAPNMLANLV
jgi:hypothetical protein